MTRWLVMLATIFCTTARAGWSPDFETGLTNSWMDHALFAQIFTAVQERCEATYYGDRIVTNSSGVVTTRLYRVDPFPATNSITEQVSWDLAAAVFRKVDELIPYYVDTSYDLDSWFSTPTGVVVVVDENGITNVYPTYRPSLPMWTRPACYAAAGLPAYNGRPFYSRQPPRQSRVVLGEVIMQDSHRYIWAAGTNVNEFSRAGPNWYTNADGLLLYPGFMWAIGTGTPPWFADEAPQWVSDQVALFLPWQPAFPPGGYYYSFPDGSFTSKVSIANQRIDRFPLFVDGAQFRPSDRWLDQPWLDSVEALYFTNHARLVVACKSNTTVSGVVTIQGLEGRVNIVTNYGLGRFYVSANPLSLDVTFSGPSTQTLGLIVHDVTNMVLQAGDVAKSNLVSISVEVAGDLAMPGILARQVYREALLDAYKILRRLKATAPEVHYEADVIIESGVMFGACQGGVIRQHAGEQVTCGNLPQRMPAPSAVATTVVSKTFSVGGTYSYGQVGPSPEYEVFAPADKIEEVSGSASEMLPATDRVPISAVSLYSLDDPGIGDLRIPPGSRLQKLSTGASLGVSDYTSGEIVGGLTTVARLPARDLEAVDGACLDDFGGGDDFTSERPECLGAVDPFAYFPSYTLVALPRGNSRLSRVAVEWAFANPAEKSPAA